MSHENPMKILLTTVNSYLARIRDAVRRHRRPYKVPYHQDPGAEKNPEEPQADLPTVVECAVQVDLPEKTSNTFYERMASEMIKWKMKVLVATIFFLFALGLTAILVIYLSSTKRESRSYPSLFVSRTTEYSYEAIMTLCDINAFTTCILFIVNCIIRRMEELRQEYMKTCNTFYERMASKMIKWKRKVCISTFFFCCTLLLMFILSQYLSNINRDPRSLPPRFVSRTWQYAFDAIMTLYFINAVTTGILLIVSTIIREIELCGDEIM